MSTSDDDRRPNVVAVLLADGWHDVAGGSFCYFWGNRGDDDEGWFEFDAGDGRNIVGRVTSIYARKERQT